ncbi:iron chelate uptake ABC transporter family permease subunit [Limimaricola cinnabarinus]|uniref:iron chelate uptake ABC transporter family permease subunit n=1 Tax=Limimaricola cinnabarinus TaxID=1125964 RepID=UPI002490B36D|nr:iron chelate uptake ABC transporter family permease subunit [Limimaricola cinnabarinus]
MRLSLVLIFVLLVGASLGTGAADLSLGDVDAGLLLAISRWPRTAAALLAGAGLALAGVQLTVQNRLVEPGLTGTPEAAMIGLLGITLFAPGAPILVKMAVAVLAALAGTLGFLALARHVPRRDPVLLPLVGLVYGGILGAAALWGTWITDLMQYLGTWTAGEFSGVLRGRYELLWLVAGLGVLLWLAADRITILGLGEAQARSLGLDFDRLVLGVLGLLAAALAQALLRRPDHAALLPAAAGLGALILVAGQFLFERILGFQSTLAVIVEFLGGLVFLALVLKGTAR